MSIEICIYVPAVADPGFLGRRTSEFNKKILHPLAIDLLIFTEMIFVQYETTGSAGADI